jgi:hypothetical protein
MSTFREIVYMCSDLLKISSDDEFFTEDHFIYLLKKYRSSLLAEKYKSLKKQLPRSNYQTLCIDLEVTPEIQDEDCGEKVLKSTSKIPSLLPVGITSIYPADYMNGDITWVSYARFKYVGHNKWLKNIMYGTVGPDNYLYIKSQNPQSLYLNKIKMTGVFEDIDEAAKLACENSTTCDVLDSDFPLEEDLIPNLIQLVVAVVKDSLYKPEDEVNNASDDMSSAKNSALASTAATTPVATTS